MFYKNNKNYLVLLLLYISFICFQFNQVFAEDAATIIDSRNGDYISGPQFNEEDTVVRLVLQDFELSDASIYDENNKFIRNYRVYNEVIERNQTVKIKNIGTLNGESIVFCLTPLTMQNEIEIGYYVRPQQPVVSYDADYNIWIEDLEGNLINDENVVFLMSSESGFAWFNSQLTMDYTNLSSTRYFIIDNVVAPKFKATNSPTNLHVIENGGGPYKKMTFGFKQLGDKVRFEYRLPAVGRSNAIFFLDPENTTGITIPYQRPVMYETRYEGTSKTDWDYAQLKVIQELPRQTYNNQYPNPLELVLDIDNDLIKMDKLSTTDLTIKSAITNAKIGKVDIPTTGPNANKIVGILTRNELISLKDNRIVLEGLLPLNLEHPDIYDKLDSNNYIKIEGGISLKRIENQTKEQAGLINPLYTKIPAPRAIPVEGTAVYQGSKVSDLDPDELLTNLESYIPNDKVNIIGFESPNYEFASLGLKEIIVIIESKVTGIQSKIPVNIQVISKDLELLEPIAIIPDVAAKNLSYTPSFKQIIKPGNTTTTIDNVVLTTTFSEGINVKESDFKVYSDGIELARSAFISTLNLTNKTYSIQFSNSEIKKQLGKTIEIRQTSKLKTDNVKIVDYYSPEDHQFKLPIKAYHSFGEKGQKWVYTQAPKSEGNQVISYQPDYQAKPVPRESVTLDEPVRKAKDYIAFVKPPDFDFDEYLYSFESKPDFSTPGEKSFNIIIESSYFGSPLKVPIVVDVVRPDVEVTVNYYQWLDGDFSTKRVLDNLTNGKRKDKRIETTVVEDTTIKELLKDNPKLQAPPVSGYTFDTVGSNRIVVSLDSSPESPIELSEKMPTENFSVNYYYEPVIQMNVPSEINFGVRENRQELYMYGMVPNQVEKNNEISVIDTYETTTNKPRWTLYASTEGFYNEKTGIRLLADIILNTPEYEKPKQITNESTPLFINDTSFEKTISLIDDKQKEGLFVNVSRVKELGKYNAVLKYTLQAVP